MSQTKSLTQRVITVADFERVKTFSHPKFLSDSVPTWPVEKLHKALAWARSQDKQVGEEFVFEPIEDLNPKTGTVSPLDQKLIGYRYFKNLNAFLAAILGQLAKVEADAVFNA